MKIRAWDISFISVKFNLLIFFSVLFGIRAKKLNFKFRLEIEAERSSVKKLFPLNYYVLYYTMLLR